MAAFLGAFLLWLFATGEYKAWASLISTVPNTGGATGSWETDPKTPTVETPDQMIRAGADWVNTLSGDVMAGQW